MLKRLLTILLLLVFAVPATISVSSQETPTAPFPVTIKHKFGETTFTKAPERVVAIGYTEQDFLLALGIEPIAVRYWYGDETNAIFPWAEEAADGATPQVLNMPFGNLNYEAILALKPDFISAVGSGITKEEYDNLSQIAPVLAQTDEYIDFGVPWESALTLIGEATGKADEAQAILDRISGKIATIREENPEWEGKTVAVIYANSPGSYGFYTSQDSRARFFTNLGFVISEDLLEVAGDKFYADVSAERIDLLDADLVVVINLQFIEGGVDALEAEPLFASLKAVKEGRVLYFDATTESALGFSSPLSLEYALDVAIPKLQAIFGTGDATPEATAEATAS
jgi:iron complex transport system substrate-binding protein